MSTQLRYTPRARRGAENGMWYNLSMTIERFQKTILDWYADNRRDLPWRRTEDPYKILVSEVMLQQTQISRVLPKYQEFLKTFSTLEALTKAADKKLLKVWTGLGYWRRAKYLKETAKRIVQEARTMALRRRVGPHAKREVKRDEKPWFERNFPKVPEHLEKLPGIGHYTARAFACFAFGSKEAFLDTNIRRVYLHFFFPKKQNISDKQILPLAQRAIDTLHPNTSPRKWHYALMDYGALVLRDKNINKRSRHWHRQSAFEGSFRSFRTKAVRFLLAQPHNRTPKRALAHFLKKELKEKGASYLTQEIVGTLLKDNLIKKSQKFYSL